MATKICKKCGEEKDSELFPRGNTCKACWYDRQKKARAERKAAWLLLNPIQPKPIVTHKTCSICGVEQEIENFNFCNVARNVRSPYCKPCQGKRAYAARLRRGDVDRERLKYRCNLYSTTVEWYDQKQVEQDGKCALCKQPETHPVTKGGKIRRLAIDHCHNTNKVRGLLCFRCNTALRQLEAHGLGWAATAVEYLKKYQET